MNTPVEHVGIRAVQRRGGLAFALTAGLLGLTLIFVLSVQAATPVALPRNNEAHIVMSTMMPLTQTYGLLPTNPYGVPGVLGEFYLQIWGREGHRSGGDAYSPRFLPSNPTAPVLNPWYDEQPYGYLFRIDVPASYTSTQLLVEMFDPDTYNRPGVPPTWPGLVTPTACSAGTPCVPITFTPVADQFASCTNPNGNNHCTNGQRREEMGMKHRAFPTTGKSAYWRVDSFRRPFSENIIPSGYDPNHATTTQFILWHFYPNVSNPFDDPALLSDQPGGASLADFTAGGPITPTTDLSWVRPDGFTVELQGPGGEDRFLREADGSLHFYLYVQGIAGSSQNGFDLRVGPPQATYDCGFNTPCYINTQYRDNVPDWVDGGATIRAARSLPIGLFAGGEPPLLLTQIESELAGHAVNMRHFDQDCSPCNLPLMTYQLQLCVQDNQGNYAPCADLTSGNCFGDVSEGYPGRNDDWYCNGCPNPELVDIPGPETTEYAQFFGPSGECSTSWLRVENSTFYWGDNEVWEVILPVLTATPTFTSTPSHTETPTNTSTSTATSTATSTGTATATGTLESTSTSMPTDTAVSTSTGIPSNTATNVPTGVPSNTVTRTATQESTATGMPTGTMEPSHTGVASNTPANTSTSVSTNTPTEAATGTVVETSTSIATGTETGMPTSTATVCTVQFTDVPPGSTFYPYVICLACERIISGYECGGTGEPCDPDANPYFRPGALVSRGQVAKIVSQSAGFGDVVPAGQQTFEDVPPSATFWLYVERLYMHDVMSGYACGGAGEPCGGTAMPYFRPSGNASRGQISKIAANAAGFDDTIGQGQQTFADMPEGSTFHLYVERMLLNRPGAASGYACGGAGEPCDDQGRPYFRPGGSITRGQTAKIAAGVFYPGCEDG